MRRLVKWVLYAVGTVVVVFLTVILLRAFDARRKPPLKPWHEPLEAEFRAKDADRIRTLDDYLALEERVFQEMDRQVYAVPVDPEDQTRVNRYWRDSPLNPLRFTPNWNRTQQLEPQGAPRGGVLLIHGLTDSPYSVRAVAEIYRRHGFYALCMRMPGHGTVPGALTTAHWEDWRAAARIGVRHVRRRIGPTLPIHLAGYSNGGEIVTQYAVESLTDPSLPRVARVALFSPMIGVSAFAGLARVIDVVGAVPFFEQSRWLDVLPEYIPFKYDSFPAYAGQQTAEATRELDDLLRDAARSGRIRELPPILAFVSLVDSTVNTWATVDRLYKRLQNANGSALVLFDLNRSSAVRPFLKTDFDGPVQALWSDGRRRYSLTLVTNMSPDSPGVVARTAVPGDASPDDAALGMDWPKGVFSLSHLAVPFRPDDPLFGIEPDMSVDYGARLGTMTPRGERDITSVGIAQFMRLNCNPFFPYMEHRLDEWIAGSVNGKP